MATITLLILTITIVLFIFSKWPPDAVALLSMLSLFLVGVISTQEALSGFSNPTVIMIAALFIIGDGLARTGWTALAGQAFVRWSANRAGRLLVLISAGSGLLSGFVSNTGTVATLLPVTVAAAWKIGTYPSKFLLPVAFSSNTGGLLTLTGTPPNIIVSDALTQAGYSGFSFFEFSLIGIPLLLIALVYFRWIAYALLPERTTTDRPVSLDQAIEKWQQVYQLDRGYHRLRIRSASPLIGTRIADWNFEATHQLSVLRLKRRHPSVLQGVPAYTEFPTGDTVLRYHDIITVRGESAAIHKLMLDYRLGMLPLEPMADELENNLINQEVGMAEVVVTPKSQLVGRQLQLGAYFEQFGVQLVAASRNNRPIEAASFTVTAGDAFLVRGSWERIGTLQEFHENLVIVGSPEGMVKNVAKLTPKSYIALATLILLILLLVLKALPGAIAALCCAGVLLLTGCVPMKQAYRSISWTSVIMIAAMIPMGVALQKTGLAQSAADGLITLLGSKGPSYLLAGVFVLTAAFSQTINNSATAVLMAPIALLAASQLGIAPEPLLITVAISASTAFLTPVGTTTNAMVLSAGGYQFGDYVKVGGPLLLLFLIVTMLLVPIIWPF